MKITDMELRGFEVAKLVESRFGRHWEVVGKYRPTQAGLESALQSAAALNKNPGAAYTVRQIVSFNVETQAEQAPEDNQLGFDFSDTVKEAAPSEHPNPVEGT